MSLQFVSNGVENGELVISVRSFEAPEEELKQVRVRLGETVPDIASRTMRRTTDEDATRDAGASWAMDQIRGLALEEMPDVLDATAAISAFISSDDRRFVEASAGKPLI